MVQVQVHGIGIDARWAQPIVLLQEIDGRGRILPVWMAEPDAAAVVAARSGADPPRPDTHTLIRQVLYAFGRTLTGVTITEMRDGVFHAELVVDGGLRIDSRTSDAIALALRAGVDIEATEAVLDRAGVPPGSVVTSDDPDSGGSSPLPQGERPVDEADVERFRRMLDDVSPSDFERDP
ncbi:bifunctional nuclease family protein [Pseudonocardia endophytica]|uniref:BFN domain-containing protein n=1 Tax=Pseudonocardia endophytica TaxID=401976 RepID=A0A4V2PIU5_PSEEN|nr:bifunctional nuclease family protein [Pseudonocardia endophytica]TCK25966.1 hypothetical protein EV378_1793 [Pseudonocardia endophytica]